MKNLFLSAVLMTALFSCNKSNNNQNQTCNCGVITSDNASDYSVVIKNTCSGNLKTFTLSESDWLNAYVGSDYCITNVTSW